MSRKDIVTVREYTASTGEVKKAWTKIGTAWPVQNGDGYRLVFDALPVPTMSRDGKIEVTAMLFEPKQDDRPAPRQQAPARGRPAPAQASDYDDQVPF